MISASIVKELREKTGAGMMDCKRALTETDGDIDRSVELLREKGLAAAAKKSGRIAAEGLVCAYISEDMKAGSVVEVNCETDFVADNEEFITLTKNIAMQAGKTISTTIDELVSEKYIADGAITVNDAVTNLIAKLGENMSARRFQKFSIENGIVQSYIHGGGRIGVLVELSCMKQDEVLIKIAKDVAMQIAAASPLFLDNTCVDNETLEKEKEIYRVQAKNEGKPEKIIEKMVMGRVNKYYKEVCLLEQIWVKNADYTIKKYLQEESKKLDAEIKVTRYVRFERGEGIEKKEENFAEEVQRQIQGK